MLSHSAPTRTEYLLTAILLLAALFSASRLQAQNVTVMRDGSLVFELANERSAVLDILPRGTSLELVKRGDEWSEVILRNPTRRGFLRSESLTSEGIPAPAMPMPGAAMSGQSADSEGMQSPSKPMQMAMPQPGAAGGSYAELMQRLDNSESGIRSLELTLSQVESMLDSLDFHARMQQAMSIQHKGGMKSERNMQSTSSEMTGGQVRFGLGLLGGYYLQNKDILSGVALLCSPSWLHGVCIELDGGYLFQDSSGSGSAAGMNLGLLVPLGSGFSAFKPYLAGGGGVVRRDCKIPGLDPKLNATANLGIGGFIGLSANYALRIEARSTWEFTPGDHSTDQRLGISLHHWF